MLNAQLMYDNDHEVLAAIFLREVPFPGDNLQLADDLTVRVIRRTFFPARNADVLHNDGPDVRLYVRAENGAHDTHGWTQKDFDDERYHFDKMQARYLVYYQARLGGMFSAEVDSTLELARRNRDLFVEDGFEARIMRVSAIAGLQNLFDSLEARQHRTRR